MIIRKSLNSSFTEEQITLIKRKQKRYRFYFALLFKYYEVHGDFFKSIPSLSGSLMSNICRKIFVRRKIITPGAKWIEVSKKEIREYFSIVPLNSYILEDLKSHLYEIISCEGIFDYERLEERGVSYLGLRRVDKFSLRSLSRLIRSVVYHYDKSFFSNLCKEVTSEQKSLLDSLLILDNDMYEITKLKRWVEAKSVDSIKLESEKLSFLNRIISPEIIMTLSYKQLRRYYRIIYNRSPSRIKDMEEDQKYSLLLIFVMLGKEK